MVMRAVHEKRLKRFPFVHGFFHSPTLVVQFTAKAGSAAVLLTGKFTFHPPLVSDKKAFASFNVQINTVVAVLEMRARVQDAVSQEIQSHSVCQRRAKWLDDVKREGGSPVCRLMKESDCGVESDRVKAGFSFGAQQSIGI